MSQKNKDEIKWLWVKLSIYRSSLPKNKIRQRISPPMTHNTLLLILNVPAMRLIPKKTRLSSQKALLNKY
jgi:hypothetical protein